LEAVASTGVISAIVMIRDLGMMVMMGPCGCGCNDDLHVPAGGSLIPWLLLFFGGETKGQANLLSACRGIFVK